MPVEETAHPSRSSRLARLCRRSVARAAGLVALVVLSGCAGRAGPVQPLAPGGYHVLFIGNSLTYVNDLPGTLARLADSAGDTIRSCNVSRMRR